ncbi:tRNA guanosine(34) transglycosylase Tgt [Candidatus Viridilinea mediisalina]|uniref:Queuine tRNA-ribosyltransferase n=1 Tax=Candidatus Viridilinea mediisalina TaxID=2024553 RepID=A0A2A6RNC8_9CHLR|nr:tRNA guanosine(34) transglycosylase Tgt [Candidatus Viridilinea mediisalina]PDW04388.1 tRNA guanosine(34) transglycosylase Tgt [Candidatus Viridilinea mediisalina]
MPPAFHVIARDPVSRARAGVVTTAHGSVATPVFMPVGTRGTVKSLTPSELSDHGAQIILGNTYHLYLQPGHELLARRGGLHRFMGWDGPILTDSGGFQVFSLIYGGIADELKGRRPQHAERMPDMVRVTEDAVIFKSYLDGSRHVFTPERSIQVQHGIGADIMVCFDELPPFRAGYDYTAQSMERTHRWAARCLAAHHERDPATLPNPHQLLFGIVHGGVFPELRQTSAEVISTMGFDGLCIGGSLGADKPQMYAVVEMTVPHLPDGLARHLLGVGDVDDLLEGVARGIDMFDCVSPTRLGRHGTALVRDPARRWKLNVSNAALREDDRPLQPDCPCYACRHFSRAYIHYLYRAKELLGIRLVSLHNVAFLLNLMAEVRNAIVEGRFAACYAEWLGKPLEVYSPSDKES